MDVCVVEYVAWQHPSLSKHLYLCRNVIFRMKVHQVLTDAYGISRREDYTDVAFEYISLDWDDRPPVELYTGFRFGCLSIYVDNWRIG